MGEHNVFNLFPDFSALHIIRQEAASLSCSISQYYWIDCDDIVFPSNLWFWSGSYELSWGQTLIQNYCKDLMFILTQVHERGTCGGRFLGGELGV